jgi:hypothetical protein
MGRKISNFHNIFKGKIFLGIFPGFFRGINVTKIGPYGQCYDSYFD